MANWLGMPAHARWLENETDALLRFARASRTRQGFGYLDADGSPDPARPTELWITCRMIHAFSLGALLGRPGCAPLVDHGLAALTGTFEDAEHGGWFPAVGEDGPTSDRKEAYPHAFVLLATSSATAADRPGAAELFARARQVSLERFWREDEGMVVESWDRTFTELEPYRGVNANMHTVEAYLATADVTGDDAWLDRAVRIVARVVDGFARAASWRIPEHFDPAWTPLPEYNRDHPAHPFRPFGATVGHWFEWARLTLQARDALVSRGREAGEWMLDGARSLFAAGAAEGWAVDGADGFVYTVDFDGRPVVRERMHWVLTEALAAAAVLHRVTGEADYERWYRSWWDYAAAHLLETPGAWRHELDAGNRPSARTWAGKPDVYHALQATLLPRLPVSPAIAPALAAGLLDL
jgi:mannose/cellobiose epimerase-like protein (N-acyl-D-glucosamine 2-epimerase family)